MNERQDPTNGEPAVTYLGRAIIEHLPRNEPCRVELHM